MTMINKINPAAVYTPRGFRRLKKGEQLREGDLFLHCIDLTWQPVWSTSIVNNFSNCIRPIRLIPQHCSYNDFL